MQTLVSTSEKGRPAQTQDSSGAASSSKRACTAGPPWLDSHSLPPSMRRASSSRPQPPSAASWLNKVADGVRL